MKRHLATLATAVALTVVAGTAWGYWSAGSVVGGNGGAAAASVNPGTTPTVSAVGPTVTVSWTASTLSTGGAVAGYLVKRYDASTLTSQTILSACTGTITALSCVESNVPNGSWVYSVTPVFATSWQGTEGAKSATVMVDGTAPTNAITLSSVSGGAAMSGTTVYYLGTAAGSLRLTNAVTDAFSGPASSQTAALTGTTTGWTHIPSTVSTPTGGPYVSNTFDWSAATTSSPAEAVTGRDAAGNAAVANLSFVNDSTAPSVDTISYPDGYSPGRSVSVSFTTGTDSGSGIATRRLQRSVAPLTGDVCGTFGAFGNIGADTPTSPYVDSALANGCYVYRYAVTDRVGNQDLATSANVVKIGYAAGVTATPGLLSYWRLGESGAAVATDSFTGSDATALTAHTGELGATWTYVTGGDDEQIVGNRITSTSSGRAIYTASVTPASPDYSVSADLFYKGALAGDMSGVIGRASGTTTPIFYMARYQQADQSWNLVKYSGTTATNLGKLATQPLTVGSSYTLRLEMTGTTTTTLRLFVNGVLKVSATDSTSPITIVGLAGIMEGDNASLTVKSTAAGLHLDNFKVVNLRAVDSKGTNHAAYVDGVTVGVAGALAGATNTAAQFDGVDDYVQATGTTGIPVGASTRSVEAWFKTTSSLQQVIFDYGSLANTQEFGLWIDTNATSMTAWGWGNGNDIVFPMPAPVNNGVWHQAVLTYSGTALTLYLDGVAISTQAATRATVMSAYGFGIGATVTPGDANSGLYFNGSIDEVSFYTTALSQATVTDHFQLASVPPADTSGPTGGSVDASGLVGTGSRYAPSTTLSLVLAQGSDPSGVAPTGNTLLRATATLTNGTCGTFGSYSLVTGGTDPASPKTDTVTDQACYSYQYVVLDTLGNSTTYTSPSIKLDTTAPSTPTLAFSVFTNAWWTGSGTTVYYRSAAASGSFTATGSATDAVAGVASYAFPGLGTNWTATPGALGVDTYSWSGAPAAPGTRNVTATSNAGLVSGSAPFTLTADDTAPTAGTVTYTDTSQTTTTISVGFTTGTDAGSGIATRLLQRAAATLTGSTCGSYGAFATITGGTNPASSPVVDTVTGGSCYQYRYVVSDNVGNADTATSPSVVKVVIPCGTQLLGNPGFESGAVTWTGTAGVVTTGGTVAAHNGTWKALVGGNGAVSTDTVSQAVTIPAGCSVSLTYWLRVTTAELSGPFDHFNVQVTSGATTTVQSFTDRDQGATYVQRTVDLSAYSGQAITLTFQSVEDSSLQTSFWVDDVALTTSDTTGPTGGSVDASGLVGTGSRYAASTSLSLVLAKGTDPAGVANTGNTLLRASATLTNGACGTFGTYTLITGGTDPVSPKTDSVTDQACYSYHYVVLDTLGNATTYASPSIKVDTTAPGAPSLGFSAFTNTWWTGSGTTVYYRSAAASGSFTATGTATDAVAGIASYAFPGLGANWTSTPGALGVNTYSWSGAPAAPGTNQVTATNNAGGTSANSPFTMTADDTAPTADVVTYASATQSTPSISVGFTTGTDAGSGIGTRLLQRASATLTGTTCGTFGAFATIVGGTNPAGSPVVDTVTGNSCYQYRYVVSDNLGNADTATSGNVVKVSSLYFDSIMGTSGLLGYWRLGEALPTSAVADSKGTNNGSYLNTPTVGVAGAIAGDTNTAAQFDGINDYATITRQISGNFSIEFWFKSTQGIGTSTNWRLGAGLVDSSAPPSGIFNVPQQDFGVSLRSDGVIVAGVGGTSGLPGVADKSILSSAGYDDGAWHHVVFTRSISGAMVLYVDGASAASGTGNTAALTGAANINFGRIQTGTDYYQGLLDDVSIYTSVLSGATALAHYNAAH